MKMRVISVIIIVIFSVLRTAAQNPNIEKINSYKIAFFTRSLNLSSQEAEKFWPVYNSYQKQKRTLQQDKNVLMREFNQKESSLSESQLIETGDKLIAIIARESSLAVEFHKTLKMVLPPAKVIRFYQAENQFKTHLLNELRDPRSQPRPMPRRNL